MPTYLALPQIHQTLNSAWNDRMYTSCSRQLLHAIWTPDLDFERVNLKTPVFFYLKNTAQLRTDWV